MRYRRGIHLRAARVLPVVLPASLAFITGPPARSAAHSDAMTTRHSIPGSNNPSARRLRLGFAPISLLVAGVLSAAAVFAVRPFGPDGSARGLKGERCSDQVAALGDEWGITNEWRALAPVPVPHEASPTSRIGTWVERSPGDASQLEMRRVSAGLTEVATIDAASCTVTRSKFVRVFNTDSLRNAFTDEQLAVTVSANRRGMIYVWSPRMPLSVKGLETARASAAKLGIAFTAVVAETNDAELRSLAVDSRDTQRMESIELVYRNATIHYPAAVFYADGKIIDGAFPGYKETDTYVRYAREQFASAQSLKSPTSIDSKLAEHNRVAPKLWFDKNVKITEVASARTPRRIGFFFKPIAGTNLVSYNANSVDFFFNMKTGEEIRVPGHIDPVPTPDGRFLTLPGLAFFRIPALIAGDVTPMAVDRDLPDEYQTASILSENSSNIRYRVVTGWNAGARFRDYDVALDKKGVPLSVTPLAEPFVPCSDKLLTLPINAKSGTEFGAFDARAKTNLILEVVDATKCAVKLDLGFASGKIAFSYDGASIAFATSRINTTGQGELIRPSEMMFKDALVLTRKTGRIVSLSQNEPIAGLTFPEFQKDGTVMLLEQYGPGRAVEQLRVVSYK